MCGSVPCNTGCGDFNEATPQERCKPRIVQQGGLSETEVNAILVEEGDDNTCTRSTVAYNAARAYADAVIIIAKRGERHLVASVHSKSAVSQTETLQLEHVNIPIGVVTHADGALLPFSFPRTCPLDSDHIDFSLCVPRKSHPTIQNSLSDVKTHMVRCLASPLPVSLINFVDPHV